MSTKEKTKRFSIVAAVCLVIILTVRFPVLIIVLGMMFIAYMIFILAFDTYGDDGGFF